MDKITTAAELDALPVDTIVKVFDEDDPTARLSFWLKGRGGLWWTFAATTGYASSEMAEEWTYTVLYRPDVDSRTEPTEDQVAAEIERYLKANTVAPRYPWEGSGIGASPLELARAVLALLPQRAAPSVAEIEALVRANQATPPDSPKLARAVAALYADRPTVAETAQKGWARGYTDACEEHGIDPFEDRPPNPYGTPIKEKS